MKKLIVVATLITLQALLSGCSILNGGRCQSCSSVPPESAFGFTLPRFSLPWKRNRVAAEEVISDFGSPNCATCNSGYVVDGTTSMNGDSLYEPSSAFTGPAYQPGPVLQQATPLLASPGIGYDG